MTFLPSFFGSCFLGERPAVAPYLPRDPDLGQCHPSICPPCGHIVMQPKPIRSFARGLAVLSALNRHGSATALTLARETGVPRATVYRLLQTLLDDAYVGRGTADDRFHLRLKVRSLAEGFEDEQWISAIAGPALFDLTRRIAWPCDVSA